MQRISEIIKAMSQAGAPLEAVVIAVAAIEDEQEKQSQQRAKAAERKRAQRKREGTTVCDSHATVTGQSQGQNTKKEKHPPNEYISNPPEKKKTPSSPKGDAPPKRKALLPNSWVALNFENASIAQKVVDGWPPGKLEMEQEKFIAYHTAKGTLSHNWQANWRTWVLNNEKYGNGTNLKRMGGGDGLFDAAHKQLTDGRANRTTLESLPHCNTA